MYGKSLAYKCPRLELSLYVLRSSVVHTLHYRIGEMQYTQCISNGVRAGGGRSILVIGSAPVSFLNELFRSLVGVVIVLIFPWKNLAEAQ